MPKTTFTGRTVNNIGADNAPSAPPNPDFAIATKKTEMKHTDQKL